MLVAYAYIDLDTYRYDDIIMIIIKQLLTNDKTYNM